MKLVLQIVLSIATVVGLVACNQGEDRLKEKARIEGREAAQEDIKAQNENLATKAAELETDLAIRHRFYQALKGTFEGSLETDTGTFKIKLTFVPSLPPYKVDRVRQIDEIVADINNLYLKAQVIQWDPKNPMSAVGCRIENIRPDITTGMIAIASENCANFYGLWIAQASAGQNNQKLQSGTLDPKVAPPLADAIRNGQADLVNELQGEVQPSTNAVVYTFSALRKSELPEAGK